jgi:hypothetical protein
VKWSRKAAEQGSKVGQSNLAWAYREGLGVAQDYKESKRWYETLLGNTGNKTLSKSDEEHLIAAKLRVSTDSNKCHYLTKSDGHITLKEDLAKEINTKGISCKKYLAEFDICRTYISPGIGPITRLTMENEIKRVDIQCKAPATYSLTPKQNIPAGNTPAASVPAQRNKKTEYEYAPTDAQRELMLRKGLEMMSPPRRASRSPLPAPGINRPLNCWRNGRRTTCR